MCHYTPIKVFIVSVLVLYGYLLFTDDSPDHVDYVILTILNPHIGVEYYVIPDDFIDQYNLNRQRAVLYQDINTRWSAYHTVMRYLGVNKYRSYRCHELNHFTCQDDLHIYCIKDSINEFRAHSCRSYVYYEDGFKQNDLML